MAKTTTIGKKIYSFKKKKRKEQLKPGQPETFFFFGKKENRDRYIYNLIE